MNPYVKHLLDDIQAAMRSDDFFLRKKKAPPHDEFKEKLEESESFLNHDESPVFGKYCGLNFEDFPPVEKLDNDDLIALTKALVKMFESWNILVDLPENLPADFGYRLSVGLLKRSMPSMQYGFFGMDFCTGNPEGCEFQSYCPCIKYWEEK